MKATIEVTSTRKVIYNVKSQEEAEKIARDLRKLAEDEYPGTEVEANVVFMDLQW